MKRRWLQTGFLWLAIVVFIGQAWSADTAAAEQSGAGGGPTAHSPQTGASGANPDLVTLNFVNADIEGALVGAPA